MPRYYFDVVDGTQLDRDDQGIDYRDIAEARIAAMDGLGDITREILPDGSRRSVVVKVRDEAGNYVYACKIDFRGAECKDLTSSSDTDDG
ncbi:conserved hypothetical protein [Rhizobium sp. EC-SD404]|nr:conserved hypothetical protein [Rhizobium sp. EC-SD404]